MPKTAFKMNGGFKKMFIALDPGKVDKVTKKHIRRANALNGAIMEAEIRKVIEQGRGMTGNRALTVAIKGENKALTGPNSDLFRAVTSQAMDDLNTFVGVLKTDGAFNIAETIHEGREIGVSTEMRGLFFVLWQVSIGKMSQSKLQGRAAELFGQFEGPWYPLKASTTAIVIPSRPFIAEAFKATGVRMKIQNNWRLAIAAASREQTQGG